jgi:hypothetical protein
VTTNQRAVVKLVPNHSEKRFDFEVIANASAEEMAESAKGTLRNNNVEYELDGETYSTPLRTIRGD